MKKLGKNSGKSQAKTKLVPARNGGKLMRVEKGSPSLNPTGRPKGSLNSKTIIRKWLGIALKRKNPVTGTMEELSPLDMMVLKQLQKAIKRGDTSAFNSLLDRWEGRPHQRLEHTGEDGAPIEVEVSEIDYSKLSDADLKRIMNARKKH